MSSRTRRFALILSVPLLAFILVGGLLGKTITRSNTYQQLRIFEDVISLITNNYVEEVEVDHVMRGALRGLVDSLDADSSYLTTEQVTKMESGYPAPTAGVGLSLTRRYYLQTIAARDGSAAEQSGLEPGDYIRSIDGKSTRNMSVFEGSRLLRGEEGSVVSLTVIRGDAADPKDIELIRRIPPSPTVSAELAESGTGYIRISAFGTKVTQLIESKTISLLSKNIKNLIIDVRRTAEGPLSSGLTTARLFVSEGILGSLEIRGIAPKPVVANPNISLTTLPIAVLTDAGTAGAAELFAAALSGNNRAELIGMRTAGRVGLQELVKLPDGSGLWLTHGRYLNPSNQPIHEVGLEPDIHVNAPSHEFGTTQSNTDPILEHAFEYFNLKEAA